MIEFERAMEGRLKKGDWSIYNDIKEEFCLEIGLKKGTVFWEFSDNLVLYEKMNFFNYDKKYCNSYSFKWKYETSGEK